ncbi:MAG: peptidoglycan-binding protein, partial [Lactobacillaceae bacterium]|nr:peptidoglycan-binding protein [Lactobacillaceae bacterium]
NDNTQVVEDNTASSTPVVSDSNTNSAQDTASSVVDNSSATPAGSGSVYERFIAAGGTDDMWKYIVIPESGGNPDIESPSGYHGLGQTKQAWGWGSVEDQTKGMINYMITRYGSIENGIQFKLTKGWY